MEKRGYEDEDDYASIQETEVTGFSEVSRIIDLVYGGGSIGLMGLVSQAVHDGCRHVIVLYFCCRVIPKTLMSREESVNFYSVGDDGSDRMIAIGDPRGGCYITPNGYAIMLKKFSSRKILMALEGGYNLDSLANSVLACVEMLLEDKPVNEFIKVYSFESTWRVIK